MRYFLFMYVTAFRPTATRYGLSARGNGMLSWIAPGLISVRRKERTRAPARMASLFSFQRAMS